MWLQFWFGGSKSNRSNPRTADRRRRPMLFAGDGLEALEGRRLLSVEPSLLVAENGQQELHALASTIAFSSTRDTPTAAGFHELFNASEIYFMAPDGSNARRVTNNTVGDGFGALSLDGKKMVFDRSSRLRVAAVPLSASD